MISLLFYLIGFHILVLFPKKCIELLPAMELSVQVGLSLCLNP